MLIFVSYGYYSYCKPMFSNHGTNVNLLIHHLHCFLIHLVLYNLNIVYIWVILKEYHIYTHIKYIYFNYQCNSISKLMENCIWCPHLNKCFKASQQGLYSSEVTTDVKISGLSTCSGVFILSLKSKIYKV